MKYTYKVVAISSWKDDVHKLLDGWATGKQIEKQINDLADQGWEYLNPITFPYSTDGKWILHSSVRLVFRREKSLGDTEAKDASAAPSEPEE
jgi:hypothetical protein